MDHESDARAVAERMRREEDERRRANEARYRHARRDLDALVACAAGFPGVRRVLVWGSLLRPDRFCEISDIDICVEGVDDPVEWSRIERAMLETTTFPLDLVRWEELIEPHRESILARGKVLYESDC